MLKANHFHPAPGGLTLSCSDVSSSIVWRRDNVSGTTTTYACRRLQRPRALRTEAQDAGSIVSYYKLRLETYGKLLKVGLRRSRLDPLSGTLHRRTGLVLLNNAVLAIWIKKNTFQISQIALKTLYAWCLCHDEHLGTIQLPHRPLGFSDLIDTCRALREHDNMDSTLRPQITQHPLLHRHTKGMVIELREKARILLSLLVWHFDPKMASVSHGLLQFFDQPWAQLNAVCKSIYPIYSKLHQVGGSLEEDLRRLIELLRRAVISEPWVLYI